jgi:hypothetical protein
MQPMLTTKTAAFATSTIARKLFTVLALGIMFTACKKDGGDVPAPNNPNNPGTPAPAENYFASKVNMQLRYQTTDDDGPENHTLTVTGVRDSAGGKVINYKSVYADGTTISPFIYSKDGGFTLVNTPPSELNAMIEEIKNSADIEDFTLTGLPLLQKLPANPQVGAAVTFSDPMHMGFSATEEGETYRVDMYFGFSEGKVVGFEDVTTEAGTFKNCLKWTYKSTITIETGAGSDETEVASTQWFAKGIGLVKSVDVADNATTTTLLTSVTGK